MLDSSEIIFPTLPVQKGIAHILGTLDDNIELNRRTNETLEAIAKVLFKSWFVDFDSVRAKAEGRPTGLPAEISRLFPNSFEDSELGEIPSGWQGVTFDSFTTAQRRRMITKKDTIEGIELADRGRTQWCLTQ
jgi:type I restriction enzyme S subunit